MVKVVGVTNDAFSARSLSLKPQSDKDSTHAHRVGFAGTIYDQ